MDIKDLMDNVKDLKDFEFERKLNDLVRDNFKFHNLNSANKKIVLDLVKKYKARLRRGVGLSYSDLKNEMYRLYEKRLKLNLTENDLEDIREILGELKK
ncbi:MAG: hypothetical protein WC437_04590 [Patescibacteria group bacterium]|jgi:hypothetical protein